VSQPEERAPQPAAMTPALILTAVIGMIIVAATLAWGRSLAPHNVVNPRVPSNATEQYGYRLIAQTTEVLGPDVADPNMRYMSSRLNCASCHIGGGLEPGNLSLTTSVMRYPRTSPRSGAKETMEQRINGCMMRSMNGRMLAENSPEMIAMVAYMQFLAKQDAAMDTTFRKAHDPAPLKTPNRAANLQAGQRVYEKRCGACHGDDGAGLQASPDPIHGYVFPPLWGPNSFNDGAGMHRVLTAARFIKAKMPLGKPDLSDDEAFDVAAYMNSKPRPEMAGLDRDYPDRTKKPVDTSYGPWADHFTPEQHHFGPFPPIEDFYKQAK
jgi:thiosulfate dehydrogenase